MSFGDRHLYYIESRGRAVSYPIAVPREVDRWEGVTTVSDKRINPSWVPTQEMMRENPKLSSYVPGGHPMNPLGVRALYLGESTYRIHGTDAPWTIGEAVSKGCIRMFNEHALDLYQRVELGTRVTVTWSRLARSTSCEFRRLALRPVSRTQGRRGMKFTAPCWQRGLSFSSNMATRRSPPVAVWRPSPWAWSTARCTTR